MKKHIQKLKRWRSGFLALALLLGAGTLSAQQLGKIRGTVTDGDGAAPNVTVKIYQDDAEYAKQGALADENGKYEIGMVESGTYIVEVFYRNKPYRKKISVGSGEYVNCNIDVTIEVDGVVITDGKLFSIDPGMPFEVTREQIKNMPISTPGSFNDIAATGPGVYVADHGDPMNMRGGRSGGTVTFVDGVKMIGTGGVPASAIQSVMVPNSISAEYGDVTGGIVVVTTRNPGMKGFKGKPMTKEERKQFRRTTRENRRNHKGGAVEQEEILLSLAE